MGIPNPPNSLLCPRACVPLLSRQRNPKVHLQGTENTPPRNREIERSRVVHRCCVDRLLSLLLRIRGPGRLPITARKGNPGIALKSRARRRPGTNYSLPPSAKGRLTPLPWPVAVPAVPVARPVTGPGGGAMGLLVGVLPPGASQPSTFGRPRGLAPQVPCGNGRWRGPAVSASREG